MNMIREQVRTALRRLQLHPANLDVISENEDRIYLAGSLLASWEVPKNVDGEWLLNILNRLPDNAGPEKTMNAYFQACQSRTAGKP
jgi:hypothetical protein